MSARSCESDSRVTGAICFVAGRLEEEVELGGPRWATEPFYDRRLLRVGASRSSELAGFGRPVLNTSLRKESLVLSL